MHSRWVINRTNPEYVQYLSRTASISPVFAQVMINRGMKTAADIKDFLYSGVTSLADPFELPGMHDAVERVKIALQRQERIFIHGDYDTDGLTATAIMLQVLRSNGLDACYFIPNRILHGYGFHSSAVDMARKLGAALIITVDCGITSLEAVSYAKASGIDIIITDHHEPLLRHRPEAGSRSADVTASDTSDFLVPDATAVINPKLEMHNTKLSALSGAGVAFKFAQALALEGDLSCTGDDVLPLLDLAALGTMADVVPLTGENRIIVKEGLKIIRDGSRPGIRALKEVSGLDGKEVRAGRLSFTLVPRINAAGRIADAQDVVKLLLTESEEEALDLSSWLDRMNTERQKIEEDVCREALEMLRGTDTDSVIVVSGEGWHQGVLGIVASRVADAYYRPAFVFSVEDGIAKGSARSIPAFDICTGLSQTSDLLLAFGGHKQAAGAKLKAENLPAFEKMIRKIFQESSDLSALHPVLEIDADISLSEVTYGLAQELGLLEPFGFGNPAPLIGSKALEVVSPKIVGDKHLKMRLKGGDLSLDAIGFAMGAFLEEHRDTRVIDAVFSPEVNEWNGGSYLQLILKAIRPSA